MDKLMETVLSILAGSKITLEIFILTLAMSLPLGFFVALLRLSNIRPVGGFDGRLYLGYARLAADAPAPFRILRAADGRRAVL